MISGIKIGQAIYENPLASEQDVAEFVREGRPVVSFPQGCMRLENGLDPQIGQAANYLFWCPKVFPGDIAVSFTFKPIREPGLAMFWFSAAGRKGEDLFDPALAPRAGEYRQYHSGDINAYHASFFRRKNPRGERNFHTCNLRKSHGFHLVCQGADPIASVADVTDPYRIQVVKLGARIVFSINDLLIYDWTDDGQTHGPVLGGGRIGLRQMAPLIAEYSDLRVCEVSAG